MSLASCLSSGRRVAGMVLLCSALVACAAPQPSGDFLVAAPAPVWPTISATHFDAAMFSERVTSHVNALRTSRGLKPLKHDPALDVAAAIHARNMRADRSFSGFVDGAPRGERSLEERMARAGATSGVAVQNVAMARMHNVLGQPVRLDSQSCAMSMAATGSPAPMHTYDSLATAVVAQWASGMHGRNPVLSPDMAWMGTAAALDARSFICGDIFVAQVMTDASLKVLPHPPVPEQTAPGLMRGPF